MAAIDKLGIINIIDKHFDALNGEYSPYVIEGNSTVFSFFKKLYDILKDGSIFENNLLLKTYEETIKEILVKLEQIENRKIYQYNFANSSDINDIKNSFTEMLKYLWKYVDRHFPQTLTENEQKVGYYNKNFGYHIEKEIEVEHTEESYEQISNEELQAGPQEGEEYYVHPIASTEVEYNPVTELEPQAGVEYYTNPVVSTREDYSLTQDPEPQPGAEYYVRSIIETIEIYNLAEEAEPKADETYYTHPINEREVYTEESEPQQGKEYYVHPVSSIEENYSNVTEEEPQAGVEYYIHPTVEREVYNLVQDKSSVSLPYNEYYKHDENTYIPCTDEDFDKTTTETSSPEQYDLYFNDIGIIIKTIDKLKPYPRPLNEQTIKEICVKPREIGYTGFLNYDYTIDSMDPVKLEDKYGYLIFKNVNNEYVRISSDDIENYTENVEEPPRYGLKKNVKYYEQEPVDFYYYKDTQTINQLPASSITDIESQYGKPVYILTENGFINIIDAAQNQNLGFDIVIPENEVIGHLPLDREYYTKDVYDTGEYRYSSLYDYNFDINLVNLEREFSNISFRDDVNYYKFECKEKMTSGYIENNANKYGFVQVYPRTDDVVTGEIPSINIYTYKFIDFFDESDRDIYYKVDRNVFENNLKENQIIKLHLYDNGAYRRCTSSDFENLYELKENFWNYYLKRDDEYISIDQIYFSYIIPSNDFDNIYKIDSDTNNYVKITEEDINQRLYRCIDRTDYYFHEWIFDNHRWYYDIYDKELSRNNVIITTTETFKPDIDYYTKEIVEELDTNNYIKNKTNGSVTLISGLDPENNNIIKAKDIYTDEDTIYIRKGTGPIVEMYKQTDAQEAPQLLFRYDFGTLNVRSLSATNGKLFVFGNGIIIDYFKNDQNIWTTTAYYHDDPNTTAYNKCVMCGNDVVLLKQITEEGENKGKYEVYYYDYSTRSLKKTDDIEPESRLEIYTGTSSSSDVDFKYQNLGNDIIVTSDTRKTYIFNKKFTKVENTLDEYTSSNKYAGYKYYDFGTSSFVDMDWSNVEFGKLIVGSNDTSFKATNGFVSTISKNETDDNYNGILACMDNHSTDQALMFFIDQNNCMVYGGKEKGRMFTQCYKYNNGESVFIDGRKLKNFVVFVTYQNSYSYDVNNLFNDYVDGHPDDSFNGGIYVARICANGDTSMSPPCSLYLNEYSDSIINRKLKIVDSNYNEYEDLKLCLIIYDDNNSSNSYIPFIFEFCINSSDDHVRDYLNINDFYKTNNELRIPSKYNYKSNISIFKNHLEFYEGYDDDLPTYCLDFDLKLEEYLQENPSLNNIQIVEDTYSKNYIFGIKENDRYRIYKMIDGQVVPTEVYIEPNDGMTYQNMSDWVWIHLLTLNNDYENFLILINATDLITNKSSFEEGVDYFTKTVTKTYDNSSYVLAENLEEGIPYFTKTIVKEVVDDTSYVPAGVLQSFDDDIDYFTKTIAYTYDDSSYEPAGNLQSFDENTQYFNKIVTNTYDTSSYVPAENLQVFDDGANYFTKSITYTYDDSSYEPTTDLQSFDENTDYFTKKITVVTETQTISTYESDDGTELKFNGYKEDIIIGGKLLPIYNENGKVEYDNDVYIKMLGVDKVYPEIIVRLSKNEEYKYYNLNDAILTIFKNDNYKKFSTNDVDSKNVLIEYSFDNGFVVNDNNEYESPNGLIYELFLSALRSIVDSSRNYFMEKLKKYFYDGIVSRYREKKIEDKRTSLVIRDDGLNSNDMMVVPKVYEKLGGKGGSIGSITTLDFDKKINFDSSEYIRMVFDDAYYNTKTNNIELYFDLSYMNGFIKSLSTYRGIDGFINNYAMRFDKDTNIRQWLLINKKEIEEAILKNLLFAIEPCFWPDYTNDESWNKNFYVNNAAKLQKVYYYNNKTYSKEDELLKDLNLSETNKKFVEYSVIRKQRNISIDFDNDKFIILLKNEDRLTIDKELFDENDSYFERNTISNEEYNEKVADYFEKLNLEKLYLGSGYINVRKVPQKFKDNGVSELVDCEYVNKNVFNESEEFSSILDDREFIILHNVNTKVSNGNNVFYDTENNYSDIEFPYELEGSVQTIPIWKSAKLYKKKHYFELVCSNFMKKNNIEAIKQIRVMQPTNNKNRYLFNVRSIENRTTEEKGILFDINFKDLEDYKISYVLNNTLHIPNQSVLSTGINEDTLRLSSLPDNEKFDYYSDSSLRITYGDEKFPSEEQYVFGDTMYIKSPSNIVEEEELLILAERSKEYKVFTSEYIMILEPGLETNKLNIADGEYINVQILDFLQVSPGAINVELPQLVYDNEGNGSVYVKTVEPEPLIFRGFYKKFELIDSSPSLLVERRNMVNFNINKQNLTIKKELNKKITFKENLKFSKQMALRIFDESPKLKLFENKWLKCKRLNGSLECKVSNMGELQLEKIERVYLEFSEFSDRNTILQVIFLPEEARLINSVIKLLPNNYTFRNDKNAVYIYDSNGNSVDTLYKNFYLDCDVLKQGEKIIEGKKFIEFEFRPSREYFNGTDRWMQLINNQPYVIPLIEGMDQELKKFEVAFH